MKMNIKKTPLLFLVLLLIIILEGCRLDNVEQKEIAVVDNGVCSQTQIGNSQENEVFFVPTDGLLPFYSQSNSLIYQVYTNNVEYQCVKIYKLSKYAYKSLRGQEGGMARHEYLLDLSKISDKEKNLIFEDLVKVNEDFKLPDSDQQLSSNGYMELPIHEEGLYYIEFRGEFDDGGQHALVQLVEVVTAY
jgi:hypothetical protein